MTQTLTTLFDEWLPGGKYAGGFGIADDLRCVAMCCREEGVASRAEYVAEAERRGYNRKTAERCWAFVAK